MNAKLIYCNACHRNEAVYHVTMMVDLFGPTTQRVKRVQFWLCAECEKISQEVLARDITQASRVAKALTTLPMQPSLPGAAGQA